MKKIEENKWLYALVFSIIVIIFGLIIYPVLDIIICNFLTHSKFEYSIQQHILSPILAGIIIFIFEIFFRRNK